MGPLSPPSSQGAGSLMPIQHPGAIGHRRGCQETCLLGTGSSRLQRRGVSWTASFPVGGPLSACPPAPELHLTLGHNIPLGCIWFGGGSATFNIVALFSNVFGEFSELFVVLLSFLRDYTYLFFFFFFFS